MNHLCLNTFHTPLRERAEHWAEINRLHFGDLDVQDMDQNSVEAQLRLFHLDELKLYLIDAPAHRVSREAHHNHDALDDSYKLMLQLRGLASLEIAHRKFELRPGDWSLYDPRVPYAIRNVERASLLVVQIPRSKLRGMRVPELHTCEAPKNDGAGLSAVLGSVLNSLSQQLPSLPDDAGGALSETVLSLLTHTLARHQTTSATPHALPAVLKARVRQYVQQHLSDTDLSLDRIADAMRCSKRYLHRVFEDDDCTLDRYIWQARLEQAKAQLASVACNERTIAEISYSCGFRSNAHFCRLFKAEFGLSPSDHRKRRLLPH
jgi:AraC-like DNA-binding protein